VAEYDDPFLYHGYNVRWIARLQRVALWLALTNIVALVLCYLPQSQFFNSARMPMSQVDWVVLVLLLLVIVGTVLLMRSLQTNVLMILIGTALLCISFLGVIVLLLEIRRAAIVLQRAGIPAGFFGIDDSEVVRMFAPHLCRKCGYNLTGNVSGICPECGAVVQRRLQSRSENGAVAKL
jgi:predicted RNA-binding Zn-ribbon protein involved in translation (DUF1610 family)